MIARPFRSFTDNGQGSCLPRASYALKSHHLVTACQHSFGRMPLAHTQMGVLLHRLLAYLAIRQHIARALALLHSLDQLVLVGLHLARRVGAASASVPSFHLDKIP